MVPPIETGRALSELYAFETVNLKENIRKYQCIEKTYRNQRQMDPPFETAIALSVLYTFQCCQ